MRETLNLYPNVTKADKTPKTGHWALFTDAMPFELVEGEGGEIVTKPRPGGAALVVLGDLDGVMAEGDDAMMFAHAKSPVEKAWAAKRDAEGKPVPYEVERNYRTADGQLQKRTLKIVLVDVDPETYRLAREEGFSSHGWHAMSQIDDPNIVPPIDPKTLPAWERVQEIYAEHARPFLDDDTKLVSHDWQVAGVAAVLNEEHHRQSALIIHSWSASADSLQRSISAERRAVDLAAGRTDTDIRYEFLRGWYEKSSRHDTVVISSPDSARAYGSAVDWFRKNDEEFRSRNPDVTPFRPGTPLLSAIPVPGDDVHTLAEVEKHLDHIREVIAKYPAKTVTYGDGQGWPARVGSKNSEAVETGIDLSMSVFRAEWYKHGPTLIQAMGHAVHTKAPEGGYSKDHGPRLALVTSITRENAFGYKDHYEIEVVAAARAKNFELNADPNINPTFSRIVERQLEENSRQGKRGLSQHQRDRLMKEHEVEFIEFIEIVKGTFDNVLAYGARANQVLGPSRGDGYILTIREVMVVQQYLRSIGIYKPMEDPLAVPVVSRSAGANAHISNGVDRGDVPEARDPGHLSVSPELTRSGMYLPKQLQKKIHPALTTYERNRADADAAALGFTMVTAMNESLTSRASMARQHTALYAEHTPRHHMTLVQEEVEKAQRLCGILNQVLDDNGSSAFADVTDLKNGALLMTDEQRRSVEACWEELQLPITASRSRVAVPNDVLAWAVQNSPSMQLIAKPDHGWSNEKPQIHPGERVNRTDQLDDFDFAL